MTGKGGLAVALWCVLGLSAQASGHAVVGTVRDDAGGVLPGIPVEARSAASGTDGAGAPNALPTVVTAVTDAQGHFRLQMPGGRVEVVVGGVSFATVRRTVVVPPTGDARLDVVLRYVLSADVTVTGRRTFTNLADAERPAEDLVGIAQSASQGAITARQLEARPLMRSGEVLETVPGVVISQHSGEGKANQYYLRGFNLDHGTDFATTVAGMPVNMPSHAHGQGYSDLNFLIPELVSGVQFQKGPYFADQGDFATAGSATITYASVLDRPLVHVTGGGQGFRRALAAASPRVGRGHLLAALDVEHNDGPWVHPDDFRKLNGVVRYSIGDGVNGFTATAMAYHARWNATDQIPTRAIASGTLDRFGAVDATDGGEAHRVSASVEWQRSSANATTKLVAFGIGSGLNLFSNFTYFLEDPIRGDQFEQEDRRVVAGGRVSHRRIASLFGYDTQYTVGLQWRHDDIPRIGLSHTQGRQRVALVRQDAVAETSAAAYGQIETAWRPWLRSIAGLRADGYRFGVQAGDPVNGGTTRASVASPKAGLIVGPFAGTEFYLNAGLGFHSNDARGTTITRDPATGLSVDPVTPLVHATGREVGIRTVRVPHLQSSLTLWALSLGSELVFVGDAGTTEVGRPSHRSGIEFANYYAPTRWLIVDGDVAWSRARFTDADPAGAVVPGSVRTVVSAGLTVDPPAHLFGSVRWRYFGPRPLVEDAAVQSAATSLINMQVGRKLSRKARLAVDLFNVRNAADSDIDYFYTSRLPGEPLDGIDDIHVHPSLPRTVRVSLQVGW